MGSGTFLHPDPRHAELWHQVEPKSGFKQQYVVSDVTNGTRTMHMANKTLEIGIDFLTSLTSISFKLRSI
jgi:hypothetical protein